jgi:hypothetical protein
MSLTKAVAFGVVLCAENESGKKMAGYEVGSRTDGQEENGYFLTNQNTACT